MCLAGSLPDLRGCFRLVLRLGESSSSPSLDPCGFRRMRRNVGPESNSHSIGEDADSHDFAGFRDDEFQGAGPATHNCSKVYYFT